MKLLLYLFFTEGIVFIFGQVLEINNATTEQGNTFILSCIVTVINNAITFKFENTVVGSCSAPFGNIPGTCDKTSIQQNLTTGITTWMISPAEVSHNGNWKCALAAADSLETPLIIYKLPTAVLTSSGITANAVVNNTVSYTINIEVGCLFSGNGPSVNLQFMKAAVPGATILTTCTSSSTVCSTCTGCSAYSCNHNITLDQVLNTGEIEEKVAYTLQIAVGVLGTSDTITFPLFSGFTVTFESMQTSTPKPTIKPLPDQKCFLEINGSSNIDCGFYIGGASVAPLLIACIVLCLLRKRHESKNNESMSETQPVIKTAIENSKEEASKLQTTFEDRKNEINQAIPKQDDTEVASGANHKASSSIHQPEIIQNEHVCSETTNPGEHCNSKLCSRVSVTKV